MKNIQTFAPTLCCGSGICDTDADQKLGNFSANVDWVRQQGVVLESV